MDWLLLDEKINKVMRNVAKLNGEEYHGFCYNPHPYPGWCPELKHMMWGFIKELKRKEAAGVATKVDLQSLSELFDIIIELTDLQSTENAFQQSTNSFGEIVTAFNYKLLNAITEECNGNEVTNVFVSPGRLQAILVLLSNWVGWSNREQILESIFSNQMDSRDVNEMFADERYLIPYAVNDDLEEGNVPTIDLKTMMWYQKGQTIRELGLTDTEKPFKVHFKSVDFSSPSAIKKINSEINKASHGLIKELQIKLNNETRALLTDIFYFKACWKNSFDEDNTRTRNFYYKGGCAKVKMMSQTNDFRYYENDTFQSVSLDYRTNVHTRDYSMWIHLPKQGHKIKEVLAQISEDKIGPKYKYAEVHLLLPRFEIESTTSLSEVLKMFGIKDVFSSDDVFPELLPHVRIDDILQQGKITVNESGTEAAVVTSIPMAAGGPPDEMPKPIEMKVNHEFIFEIVETYSGNRLFSGIINKL